MPFFQSSAITPIHPAQMRLPQCGKCGLYRQCQSPKMEPSGRGKRSILFVGEGPGATEDEQGKQFVGKTGRKLRDVLHSLHLELEDCHVTNAIICRPPHNKIEDKQIG